MLQVETHCAACGGEMFQVRRRLASLDGPDSEPLCSRCVQEMLAEASVREDEEPRVEYHVPETEGRTKERPCQLCGVMLIVYTEQPPPLHGWVCRRCA